MPKKLTTICTMRNYRPLSSRRPYKLVVSAVCRQSKTHFRFDLSVLDDPQQAGRTIGHVMPAVLAPNSPLCRFLIDGFGVRPVENESVDLETLVGRVFFARFSKAEDGSPQEILSVKQVEKPGATTASLIPATNEERTHGLG